MRELLEIISAILPLEFDPVNADAKTAEAFVKKWQQAGELIHRFCLEIDFVWGNRTGRAMAGDQRIAVFVPLLPVDPPFLEKLKKQLSLCVTYYDSNHPEILYDYVGISAAITFVLEHLEKQDKEEFLIVGDNPEEAALITELADDFITHAAKVAQGAINAMAVVDGHLDSHLEILLSITERRYGVDEAKNLKQLINLCFELLQRYRDYKLPLIEKTVQTKYPLMFAIYFAEQEEKESVLFRMHNDILNRTLVLDEAQVNVIQKYRFFQDIYYTLIRLMDPAHRVLEIKEKLNLNDINKLFTAVPTPWVQMLSIFGIQSLEAKFISMLAAYQPTARQEPIPHP